MQIVASGTNMREKHRYGGVEGKAECKANTRQSIQFQEGEPIQTENSKGRWKRLHMAPKVV